MSTDRASGPIPLPARPALMLVVDGTETARAASASLEPAGVRTVSASSAPDAVARLAHLAPDLVVVSGQSVQEAGPEDVVRQLRTASGRRPPFVVIGEPGTDAAGPRRRSDADYLPADVGVAELVGHICSKLNRPMRLPGASTRAAVSRHRMIEEIDRELQRSILSRRPGVLAYIGIAEHSQLRESFGPEAERETAGAFDELLAIDAHPLEHHGAGPDEGFWLLMPETTPRAAAERLQKLSYRIAGSRLDVAGEPIRLTPVVGYSSFSSADSGEDLRDQSVMAQRAAGSHLDLIPVGFSAALVPVAVPALPVRDRALALAERMSAPLQVVFTAAILISLPFIVYILVWYAGFDLTTVTYPLMAGALAISAAALWIESARALPPVKLPPLPAGDAPAATAIFAAYLPNEAATIIDTITNVLGQDYPGDLQVILAYNSPKHLPVEKVLAQIAAREPRLMLLRVEGSTSKAQNVNAALAHVRGEFVGVFDADHHPAPGSFERAWRWLADGHDVVQGHCVVRNGEASWVARMVAIEFETIYAVSHPGRARLHGFAIFGGSNGYWRRDALQRIRMQRSMLTEDIDSSMRALREGFSIVSDPGLISSELAPTTMGALWNQRMRWAQGWTQTSRRHLRPVLASEKLSRRQKLGAAFLLGWAQFLPWITIQIVPILAFAAWRDGGLSDLDWLVPLFVVASVFTFSVGAAQTIFAYALGDKSIRRRRSWFVIYACHSILWFGEFKNLVVRVAQLKELLGERQWRVTPRASETPEAVVVSRSVSKP